MYRTRSPETWAKAEADYRAGLTMDTVCARYDLGRSAFKERARKGGWRRRDQSDPDLATTIDDDAPLVSAEEIADMAHRRAAQAVRDGRAADAQRWTRLHREWSRRSHDLSWATPGERVAQRPRGRLPALPEAEIRNLLTRRTPKVRPAPARPAPEPPSEPAAAAPLPPLPPAGERLPDEPSGNPPPLEPTEPAKPAPTSSEPSISSYMTRLEERLAYARSRGDAAEEWDVLGRIARLTASAPPEPSAPVPVLLEDAQ